jgi:hypothetical protein
MDGWGWGWVRGEGDGHGTTLHPHPPSIQTQHTIITSIIYLSVSNVKNCSWLMCILYLVVGKTVKKRVACNLSAQQTS